MATLRSDRRLYLTADRSEVVEEGDPRAAVLLAAAKGTIESDDVARYRLGIRDGRIVIPDYKMMPALLNKMRAPGRNKVRETA